MKMTEMKRWWGRAAVCVLLLLAGGASASTAVSTPGLDLQSERYEPTPAGESSLVVDVPRFGTDSFSMGFSMNYTHRPLVLGVERETGEFKTLRVLIENQVLGHVDLAARLCHCVVFSISLPLILTERGQAPESTSTPASAWSSRVSAASVRSLSGSVDMTGIRSPVALGATDPRLGMLLRLYGEPETSPFSISVGGYLWLPLHRLSELTAARTSDEELRVMPRFVLAGYNDNHRFQWSLTGSFLYRPEARQDTHPLLGGEAAGSELRVGTHVSYEDKARGLSLGPEVLLSTTVIPREHAFEPFYTSLEVLLGAQARVAQVMQVSLAAGVGFLRQPGTPEFRLLLRVSTSTPSWKREGREAAGVAPRRPDGVPIPVPVSLSVPVPVPFSVPVPVVFSAPVPVLAEAAPAPPRDETQGDRDGDTVPDSVDACPDQFGAPSTESTRNGCPGMVAVRNGKLSLGRPIAFASGTDKVLAESFPVLRSAADAIRASPWISKLRIEGHSDNQGARAINDSLSRRRASSVMRLLQEYGVEPARMDAAGYGPSRPIASNDTPDGRAANRRVDMVITDPPAGQPGAGP